MSLLRSTFVFGSFTMLSRILGFLRDVIMAAVLGAGPLADAFFVAFRFPNFFRQLFAEGAFNAAFVPVFSEMLEKYGQKEALAFAERALALLFLIVTLFTLTIEIFMPYFMSVIAPGFARDAHVFDQAVTFSRLMFPYLIMMSLVCLYGGMLNAMNRFGAVAFTPSWLNICLIFILYFGADHFETPAHAATWGVVIAGLAQFIWLWLWAEKYNLCLRFLRPRLTADMKKLLRLILPAAFGAGVIQINLLADTILASLLPRGAVSYLWYADRLTQLPVGVIGVALGTALLPLLSRQIQRGDVTGSIHSQNRALEFGLLLSLPAAAAFLAIPLLLITGLFEYGAFTAADSLATSYTLMAFASGLPAIILTRIFTPAFYARQDTKTPVKIAVFAVALNIASSYVMMQFWGPVGIALGTSLAAWFDAVVLIYLLYRRGFYRLDRLAGRRLLGIVFSTLVMILALVFFFQYEALRFGHKIMDLVFYVALGGITYGVLILLTKTVRLAEIKQFLRK